MGKRVWFIVLLCWLGIHYALAQDMTPRQAGDKLAALLAYIDMVYVDSASIDALSETAIVSVLEQLDPHSFYISPEELKEVNEELSGNFEGIGIQFQIYEDTILVISAISGGPSERLGIRAGDRIVSIDGKNATGPEIDNQFVFDHLRGPKGSRVEVGILRGKSPEEKKYSIVRDEIPIASLDAAFLAAPGIGYIKLNRFAQNTMPEFYEALKSLKASRINSLILDLRNNAGGYMYAAVELADQFLPPGRLIVYTEGVHSPRQDLESTWLGNFEKGEVVVLLDEGSASASEIVAGALQDWDRGIIIGRRSFGKGLVQKQFPLNDGSAVRLTTAKYYTPSGRSIQKPYENGLDDYMDELNRRFEHGELVHQDSIAFPDSLMYSTEGGRAVYGGGGIMPDVFVPWDSASYSDYYAALVREGILNDVVLEYTGSRREDLLARYSDAAALIDGFLPGEELLPSMLTMAEARGVLHDEEGLQASRELILAQLTALVARNLFDVSSYFHVIMQIDPVYLKALEVLHDEDVRHAILRK